MLKTGKNFGISSYKNNSDLTVFSTENLDFFLSFVENQKGKKIIGTHSGAFHADEVLSCTLLKFTKEFYDPVIIRSRNTEINKLTHVLVDVGGVYDPTTFRFDHHQKEFKGILIIQLDYFEEENKIKMSSAGLTYKHFGKEIIMNILTEWNEYEKNQDKIDLIYNKLYKNFIMSVDAGDNGINMYPDDIKPKYTDQTTYANRISRMNPSWLEENPDQSLQFQLAMDIAEDEFLNQLNSIIRNWIPAYSIVKSSIEKRKEFHPSGNIVFLERFCPWKEHLLVIEEEMNIKNEVKFCIYRDSDGSYRVQTIPVSLGSFSYRIGLNEVWRGLRNEELVKCSNISDIIFVHTSGFIGGAKSLESSIKMAEQSLLNK